jgi:hypothetical protein
VGLVNTIKIERVGAFDLNSIAAPIKRDPLHGANRSERTA